MALSPKPYTDRCATSAYMQLKFDHFKSIQNLSNQHPNLNYHTRVGTAGAQLEWLLCSSSCKHTAEHQKRLIDYSVAATLAHTQQSSYKWAKNNYCYRASAQLKTECEHIECTRVPSTELNRPWPQQLTELNEMSQHPIERHELITQFTHTNHDHVMRTTNYSSIATRHLFKTENHLDISICLRQLKATESSADVNTQHPTW